MVDRPSDSGSTNPYEHPSIARFLDSSEGVPEWPAPVETVAERAVRGRFRTLLNGRFDWLGVTAPGFFLALALAYGAMRFSHWINDAFLHYRKSPISPIMLAIVLGLLIRNLIGLPSVYEKGLRLCIRFVLRLGIAILGLRLSLGEIGNVGAVAVPVVIICIGSGLVLVSWINHAMGLPRRLGTLIAVGTSICGVSAIVAIGPAIDAKDDETSYAVACITVFGLIALFAYPFIAPLLFGADNLQLIGTFLGTAIHDTSQVSGAALMYDQQYVGVEAGVTALDAALVTKLFRNLCMAAVIPLMVVVYHHGGRGATRRGRQNWDQVLPLFVVGFLCMAAISSIADLGSDKVFGVVPRDAWITLRDRLIDLAKWCLAIAMAGVGLGTSLRKLKYLGWKPFCVGLAGAVLLGVISFVLITVISDWTRSFS